MGEGETRQLLFHFKPVSAFNACSVFLLKYLGDSYISVSLVNSHILLLVHSVYRRVCHKLLNPLCLSFPGGISGKELASSLGDLRDTGSILG